MKIVILGDLHFGARGDSVTFSKYFHRFFDEIFFPYCEENEITTLIQLGDMFDRRKFINYNTLNIIRERFLARVEALGMEFHAVIGNHDTYFKNTNKVNAFDEIFKDSKDLKEWFNYYSEYTTIKIGGKSFDFVPWINVENEKEYLENIKKSTSDYCVGHFEISGFEMYKGTMGHGGLTESIFKKYNNVFSGHYHTRSSRGNVHYCGTPYEITWGDYNDQRGFHVLDTETEILEFVPNPYTMHHKVFLNADFKADDLNYESFVDGFVKVYVVANVAPREYDSFMDRLFVANPTEIDLIDNTSFDDDDEFDEEVETQDTMTILYGHIDTIQDDGINKTTLKQMMQEVHAEALELENNGE